MTGPEAENSAEDLDMLKKRSTRYSAEVLLYMDRSSEERRLCLVMVQLKSGPRGHRLVCRFH